MARRSRSTSSRQGLNVTRNPTSSHTYPVSALFVHETSEDENSAYRAILEGSVGDSIPIRQTYRMDPEDCQRGAECLAECTEYRLVVFFDVPVNGQPTYAKALAVLNELLLQPGDVVSYEDEDDREEP